MAESNKRARRQSSRIVAKFTGDTVDDGTIAFDELIPVLQGLSSAYAKVVEDDQGEHHLRLSEIRAGSVEIVVDSWQWIADNSLQLGVLVPLVAQHAPSALRKLLGVLRLVLLSNGDKAVVKAAPAPNVPAHFVSVTIDRSPGSNVSLTLPREVFDLFQSGVVDGDLEKMTRPLDSAGVESAEFAIEDTEEPDRVHVPKSARAFLQGNNNESTTVPASLQGVLNSFTKSTSKGHAYLQDGSRVPYRYIGDDLAGFLRVFAVSKLVTMHCIAHLDGSLRPVRLDLERVEPVQPRLWSGE